MHRPSQARTTSTRNGRAADRSSAAGGPVAGILALQRSIGNAAVVQLLRQAGHAEAATVQRSAVHDVLRSSGRPLDESTRTEMESRLGADFSDVRIHTDSAAKASAAEVGARAYTSGNHVVIGQGGADQHTLAHELTHVIQQRQGPVAGADNGSGLKVSDPADRFEREAEANATRVMSGPVPQRAAGEAPVGEAAVQREAATAVQRMTVQRTAAAPIVKGLKIEEGDGVLKIPSRETGILEGALRQEFRGPLPGVEGLRPGGKLVVIGHGSQFGNGEAAAAEIHRLCGQRLPAGIHIHLVVCQAGAGAYPPGQRLADLLRVPVVASVIDVNMLNGTHDTEHHMEVEHDDPYQAGLHFGAGVTGLTLHGEYYIYQPKDVEPGGDAVMSYQ